MVVAYAPDLLTLRALAHGLREVFHRRRCRERLQRAHYNRGTAGCARAWATLRADHVE